MELMTVSHVVLWAVVIVQTVVLLALARLVGQLSRRFPPAGARVINPGPEIGEKIADFSAATLVGGGKLEHSFGQRGLFLLYLSPHCSTCAELLPSARQFMREIQAEVQPVWVLAFGSREAQIAYAVSKRLEPFPVCAESDLPPELRLAGAPFGLWIDALGIVKAKGMTNHREHLESLHNAAGMARPDVSAKERSQWNTIHSH